jgi:hypothetical protein
MTLELTRDESLPSTIWKSPAVGLWVAAERGSYLGMVGRIDGRYVASDATGRDLGSFVELGDAQSALDGFTGEPATSPRDVLLMRGIVISTGITALALACAVVLSWR